MNIISKIIAFTRELSIKPQFVNQLLIEKGTTELKQGTKLIDIISRPQISIFDVIQPITPFKRFLSDLKIEERSEILENAEIYIKYSGYMNREQLQAEKLDKLEDLVIINKFHYKDINSISTEGRQKLEMVNPKTIGQAKRIPGVSPSDINVLLVLLGR